MTETKTDLAVIGNIRGAMRRLADDTASNFSAQPLLRMTKGGDWNYGQDNVDVEEGSVWAVDPMSFRHGWVSWTNYPKEERKKNEIAGEAMRSLSDDIPVKADLDDTGWPWVPQYSLVLKCLDGLDKGKDVMYKTSSRGGEEAVNNVAVRIAAQLEVDTDKPVMVVSLDSTNYQHPQFGLTYKPVFALAGPQWVGLSSLAEAVAKVEAAKAEPAPEPKPVRRRRRAA